jgi:hypothetical protein
MLYWHKEHSPDIILRCYIGTRNTALISYWDVILAQGTQPWYHIETYQPKEYMFVHQWMIYIILALTSYWDAGWSQTISPILIIYSSKYHLRHKIEIANICKKKRVFSLYAGKYWINKQTFPLLYTGLYIYVYLFQL